MLRKRGHKGFTLIELLVVIAIIGVLAAIAVPVYRVQTLKARISEVTNAISHVASSCAARYNETDGVWPTPNSIVAIQQSLGVTVPARYIANMSAVGTNPGGNMIITVTLQGLSTSNPTIDGKTMILTSSFDANNAMAWTWGGTLDGFYRPKE